jgi:FdhD protein
MEIKYNILKLKNSNSEEIKDFVSVEEPLEMKLKFKIDGEWRIENLSITMRTPGNDEDLISGFLFNEKIIESIIEIEKVEKEGEKVGDYNVQNKIVATINNVKNIDIGKLKRNFITNSSCGVCGKTSLDAVEIIKNDKLNLSFPKIQKKIIMKSPELLMSKQSEFSKTGGIHASSLIDDSGKVIVTREDVGRHNALDKLIGYAHKKELIDNRSQFIACSGRLNFELVQKGLMSNIGIMAGVGAPTSLAIDLAKRFEMTLLGFVKNNSFNIYTKKERIILKSSNV